MNLRLLTTAASLCLLLTPKAHAILDINGNGLSDLWEKQYNNQQLLPPEFDPQADPDHDGWTNAEEAAAGTDPFNSITGILRPAVSHTPAFQTDSDGDGTPETLTPATLHLSWPSTQGKQYSLLHSSHPGDHGQPLEAPFLGNGNQVTYHIPATSSTGNFWRVATTDVDTDEDGLTNAEEHQLGTNANANDSDGDGIPDQSEARQGLNPNSVDTDSDGLSDLDDAVPNDSLIDWEKAPESRYVLIDVDLPEGQIAQDLNDQGQVLTQDGIWSGGLWSPVTTPNTQGSFESGGQTQAYEVSYGPSYLFNNSGRIIGHSQLQFTEGQAAGGDILASAGSYGNGGSASHLADAIPFTFQNVVSLYPLGITTDGTTFCRNVYMNSTGPGASIQRTRIAVQSGTNGLVSFLHAPNDFEFTLSPPSSNTSISRSGRLALNTVSTLQSNLPKTYQLALWNAAGQPQGIQGGSSGYYDPIHLTDLPNGKPGLCAMKDGTTAKVWLEDANGTLTESGSLSASGIQMFAGDGTAVTSDLKLWRNGKQIPLRDLCGRLGQLIDEGWGCNPLKTNRHGSILLVATGAEGEMESKILLPVDLDIEYASQAGNKELEDSKEDTGDGGYISLKSQTHQGEDITPTTYLVIRQTEGLPNDSKVRLKFNAGGRYEVSKNLLGTDLVVSEVTEFPAGQETRLYLVGETKSQSRGGEQITMQICNNGSWIDGDSLKATVVQTQFQIDLRVFIPYNWVNIPFLLRVAGGDARSYDPTLSGTYRISQNAILNLYKEWIPEVANRLIDAGKSAGITKHYYLSDVTNYDSGADHSENTAIKPSSIKFGASPSNSGIADLSGVDSTVISTLSNDSQCAIKFEGSATEPILPIAASINWRINVVTSKIDPLNPTFAMEGEHDGFPAYEIYINSKHQIFPYTKVLQWSPPLSADVWELSTNRDVSVGPAAGVIEQ